MSEVFDPENVKRYDFDMGFHSRDPIMASCERGDYILAADYYHLLALYREVRQEFIQELTRDMKEGRATLLRSLS